ncbi:glycosyltransferase involved in cell wall biosynthesis [Flavobacterium nitrogenifigens]|uniref:Glycosyltransferase involved in cell wall biosynthesis n=2 Tax=Flavobacterium TaxID=237 RepID=A0A7W7N7L5_9FLAO|nr:MULTISPECIES: glycosyltransferase [Flavobacterium]MBB4803015.1 glycosyltransferase involved in cell wall biosynthesis [Flavobacterium nitrogenifigens]MBB6387973.1 glycosyltransferase involved in cell wall biosynthesis [Flavobacterium notoginsengisoli]
MKVLLVGEFSHLHNSLKEGLKALGHEVFIIGQNDGFKNFPVDFPIQKKWDSGLLKKIKIAIFKISGFDISSYLTYRQFVKFKKQCSDFDIVQLINENSFYCTPYFEEKIISYLLKNNQKLFLLSCGYDYLNVKYCFENLDFKSVIPLYLDKKIDSKSFGNVLKFRKRGFFKLHQFIYQNCRGIIASDLDYDLPLRGNEKYLGLIPNPINTEKLPFLPTPIKDKIVIFHGINNDNYLKKGNDYFEKALQIIEQKYASRIEIITVRSVPYAEYINLYNSCHILLDQIYAYDQGYNALEAMAKGKVVFTGAETEFIQYYNLAEKVCINAIPDVDYLVKELSFLIENPEEISLIAKRARAFIEEHHNHIKIAQNYIQKWTKN